MKRKYREIIGEKPLLVLSERELLELTGSPQRKRQIRCLADNNIPFTIDVDGFPRVNRSHYDQAILGIPKKNKEKLPDFSRV